MKMLQRVKSNKPKFQGRFQCLPPITQTSVHSKIRKSTESPVKSANELNINSENDEEVVVQVGSPRNLEADVTAL